MLGNTFEECHKIVHETNAFVAQKHTDRHEVSSASLNHVFEGFRPAP